MPGKPSTALSITVLVMSTVLIVWGAFYFMDLYGDIKEMLSTQKPVLMKIKKSALYIPGALLTMVALWVLAVVYLANVRIKQKFHSALMFICIIGGFLMLGLRLLGGPVLDHYLAAEGYVFCHHDPESSSMRYRPEIWALDTGSCPPSPYK